MAKKKRKGKLPAIKRIEVQSAQMREFLERVKARAITDEDYEIIVSFRQRCMK